MMKVTASFIATAILLTGSICAYSQSEISFSGGSTHTIPMGHRALLDDIVFYTIHLLPVSLAEGGNTVTFEYSGAAVALCPVGETEEISTAELKVAGIDTNGGKIWVSTGIYYSYKQEHSNGPWARVTARIDLESGVWDLFIDDVLMLANLPLSEQNHRSDVPIVWSAEDGGVKVKNYQLTSENPHFIDSNRNGIPDSFEESAGVDPGFNRNSAVPDKGKSLLESYLTTYVEH